MTQSYAVTLHLAWSSSRIRGGMRHDGCREASIAATFICGVESASKVRIASYNRVSTFAMLTQTEGVSSSPDFEG